ncbi:MAG: MBL fold metallo-hydrolase [Jatrophihabitantaceae bacterium]
MAVYADDDAVPHLVLDAGTGLSALPDLLDGAAFTGTIVLSHLHWDHVQGLPFCRAVDRTEARVSLYVPVGSPGDDPEALLARGFSPPHFPIGPDGLLGEWRFLPLTEGRVDGTVTVARVAHKGGPAFGIRVELDGSSLAYLPDHAVHGSTSSADLASARRLIEGADVLVHDGQFLAAEVDVARAYGHATIEQVLGLADECRVGAVVLTHHAPTRTDAALDELAVRFTRSPGGRPVTFARQWEDLHVPGE